MSTDEDEDPVNRSDGDTDPIAISSSSAPINLMDLLENFRNKPENLIIRPYATKAFNLDVDPEDSYIISASVQEFHKFDKKIITDVSGLKSKSTFNVILSSLASFYSVGELGKMIRTYKIFELGIPVTITEKRTEGGIENYYLKIGKGSNRFSININGVVISMKDKTFVIDEESLSKLAFAGRLYTSTPTPTSRKTIRRNYKKSRQTRRRVPKN